ncbi:MAG TPA: aromatic amino acid ammonia-lyase, partial [Taishania sp.]|nr:aromatic amino acid ammonia-lyase [Taishania sp.]
MKEVLIDRKWLRLEEVEAILNSQARLKLDDGTKHEIQKCRDFLDRKVGNSDDLIYGVNTGFGSLCNTAISKEDLSTLQSNLVRSHACGMGELVPVEIVKRMLLLKIMGLSHGKSGVQVETVERLIYFYNNEIYPVVYQQGSLGASGDLAPLAHLCLPLLGEGEVVYKGIRRPTSEVYLELNLKPISLQSKEGLALLNGTQFMSSFASYAIEHAFKLWRQFNLIGAMSLEAYDGRINPFQ